MATKLPVGLTVAGPDGNAGWFTNLINVYVPAASITSSTAAQTLGIVPASNSLLAGGVTPPETLGTSTYMMRLVGGSVSLDSSLVAKSHLNLNVSVYTSGAQVATAAMLGWTQVGGGTPAFTQWTSVALPNLAALPSGGQKVYPGDVLQLLLSTDSTTVAWPGGVVTVELL